MRKTVARNREMFAAFEAGQTIQWLAQEHHLTEDRVQAILINEKNRQFFSPEPYYRELRAQRKQAEQVSTKLNIPVDVQTPKSAPSRN